MSVLKETMDAMDEPSNPKLASRERLLGEFRKQLVHEKRKVVAIQIGVLILAILLWELLIRLGVVRELIIGQPSKVVSFLVSMTLDGSLLQHSWITIVETVVGFVLGFILGGVLGLLLWWSKTVERVLDPLMVALNSLPKIALTPIFLLWFGIGISMKLALSFSTVFLVTFLTAAASLTGTDKELMQLTAALGGSRWQVFRYVVVPSSLPWLISAMKLSIGFGLTGAVVGEFVAANKGIGFLLLYGAQIYEMSLVWAGVVVLLVVAMLMYASVALIERRVLRWRES